MIGREGALIFPGEASPPPEGDTHDESQDEGDGDQSRHRHGKQRKTSFVIVVIFFKVSFVIASFRGLDSFLFGSRDILVRKELFSRDTYVMINQSG